jgi:hypothetical protein
MFSFHFMRTQETFKRCLGFPAHPSEQGRLNFQMVTCETKFRFGSDNTLVGFSICAFLIGEMAVKIPSPRDI